MKTIKVNHNITRKYSSRKKMLYRQKSHLYDPFSFSIKESRATYAGPPSDSKKFQPAFYDPKYHIKLFQANCLEVLDYIARLHPEGCVDIIFADPPYFLSNNGITCHAGRMVSVNKGKWDKSQGPDTNHDFNRRWLSACQRVLKPNGTIWVSGTSHIIYSVGFAMQQLGFKVLNDISWVKPNPPPNLSCRYFTHSTETVLWAAKTIKSKHTFHYKKMRELAGGKQMKNVWNIYAPAKDEKQFGKHPTQKPVGLLERIIEASSNPSDLVLDPFMGSGTTGIAAIRLNRKFAGIELESEYVDLAKKRIQLAIREANCSLLPLATGNT